MRKVLPLIFACCIGIGVCDAAVRDASTISRNTTSQRATTERNARTGNVVSRATTQQTVRGRVQNNTATARTTSARTVSPNVSRAATGRTTATTTKRTNNTTKTRSATTKTTRAALLPTTNTSQSFGTGYNTCRDAYFTCMDQFCASQDETYRRCVCSSRIYDIKSKERALSQSADQLQDFKDLNIEAIPKTAAEVQAMQSASEGEMVSAFIKDKSESVAQLAGISAVLANTKSKSLSTAGQLDIAGDINAIWATTDLTSGLNISNLTGETLYSAVHSQCANLVADRCSSRSLLNMVVSAYSMYIENDCALLTSSLGKKKLSANAAIRETEREMNTARLENYDAHNSSSINDCIAMVRRDITADAACGQDYVHCLDTTGLYLNRTTGEPIYSSNFYQLGSTLSLSDNILTNDTNRNLILELNRKRMFAANSLDTCRDLADEVWDEFMRQAITEIYQNQQMKIRDVKNECLDVVNQCYDRQSNSLKDFSNVKEQLLLGARLELSEQLCLEKLSACSNLYGGGPDGMQELLTTMADITTQKISQNCFATLQEYARDLCAVPSSDSLHSYPYACRVYAPSERRFAAVLACNTTSENSYDIDTSGVVVGVVPTTKADAEDSSTTDGPVCVNLKKYRKCNENYYMLAEDGKTILFPPYEGATFGNRCVKCPNNICPRQGEYNQDTNTYDVVFDDDTCGDYAGSLYQKLVRYAIQACLRPSDITTLRATGSSEYENATALWKKLSVTLLQDVNATMDMIRVAMSSSLKAECERLGGYWISSPWNAAQGNNINTFAQFYNETGANKNWGYCANPDDVANYYEMDLNNTSSTDDTGTPSTSGNTTDTGGDTTSTNDDNTSGTGGGN